MSNTYRIEAIRSVVGDWFSVSNPEQNRWFIERVIAWALVEAEGQIGHVKGILSNGIAQLDEGDVYYVAASDVGLPWHFLGRALPSGCRERCFR